MFAMGWSSVGTPFLSRWWQLPWQLGFLGRTLGNAASAVAVDGYAGRMRARRAVEVRGAYTEAAVHGGLSRRRYVSNRVAACGAWA